MRTRRPFVTLNLAITADGKIAPAHRRFEPFSTRFDHERMMELRSQADAVLSGARTVAQPGLTLGPGGRKWRAARLARGLSEYNLRVLVSGSASLDPGSDIFQKRFSPILLLTTEAAPKARLARLRGVVEAIHVSPGRQVDFRAALGWLASEWKVRRLLCEGGGETNAALFTGGLVDELYLTICPVLFGGRHAPTIADGPGVAVLSEAARLRLISTEQIGNELYCRYRASRRRPPQ